MENSRRRQTWAYEKMTGKTALKELAKSTGGQDKTHAVTMTEE
jgi:hypothetical protein